MHIVMGLYIKIIDDLSIDSNYIQVFNLGFESIES